MNMLKGAWIAITRMSVLELVMLVSVLAIVLYLGFVLGSKLGNPFGSIKLHPLIVLAILIAIFVGIASQMSVNTLMIPKVSDYAIVSFELAKDKGTAQTIIDKWSELDAPNAQGKKIIDVARRDIYVDFAFIISYVALLGFLCFWIAAARKGNVLGTLGLTLGWSVAIAGLFDVFENISLLRMIAAGASDLLVGIAFWTALPKLIVTLYFTGVFIILIVINSLSRKFKK